MFNNYRVDIKKFAQLLRKKNLSENMPIIQLNVSLDKTDMKLGLDNLRFIQEQLPQRFLEELLRKESFIVEIKIKNFPPLLDVMKKLEKEKEEAIVLNNKENLRAIRSKIKSSFEAEVINQLKRHINPDRIIAQYPVGGFRIDFVVKDLSGKSRLAIECDDAMYHSNPQARNWDLSRQQQLEERGFIFHRICSTDWYENYEKELHRTLTFISENENVNNGENLFSSDVQISNQDEDNTEVEYINPESILLKDLNVNQFTKNYLKAGDLKTVQDLLLINKISLLGLGMKNIDKLRDELKRYNIDFDYEEFFN